MMTEQEIATKLTSIGFKESEIPAVVQDVAQIIYGKVMAAYLPLLPEEDRARIMSASPEELQQFLAERAGSLPPFPQAQFDAIYESTWQDYFKSVG